VRSVHFHFVAWPISSAIFFSNQVLEVDLDGDEATFTFYELPSPDWPWCPPREYMPDATLDRKWFWPFMRSIDIEAAWSKAEERKVSDFNPETIQRRDRKKLAALRTAIREGPDSGPAEPFDIEAILAKARADYQPRRWKKIQEQGIRTRCRYRLCIATLRRIAAFVSPGFSAKS
jgi:hypothetical protein